MRGDPSGRPRGVGRACRGRTSGGGGGQRRGGGRGRGGLARKRRPDEVVSRGCVRPAAGDEVVFAFGTHLWNCVFWVCRRGSPGDSLRGLSPLSSQ
jgi:hypothetical protein